MADKVTDKSFPGVQGARVYKNDKSVINWADFLERGSNAFGEHRVAMRHPQLTLNAGIDLSERRDYIVTENGGTVTDGVGTIDISVTADAGSVAKIFSRQRCNYVSGGVLEGGIGLDTPTQPTGNGRIDWGFADYDNNNALRFSWRSDGLYLELKSNGSTIVSPHQDNWNIDSLNGSGPSGVDLDPADGYVYQIPFVYYGYGDIIFQVLVETEGRKRFVDVHRISRDGSISIAQPNLPLAVEVYGDGAALDCHVGGRQISSSLPDNSVDRTVGARRLQQTIGTSFVPVISFRHKTGFENIFLVLTQLSILTDEDLILEIQRNATLGGNATFNYIGNYSEDERATEWDVTADATGFAVGQTMWEGNAAGGQANRSNATTADVPQRPISELDTITLAARSVSGSATVTSTFKINEHW